MLLVVFFSLFFPVGAVLLCGLEIRLMRCHRRRAVGNRWGMQDTGRKRNVLELSKEPSERKCLTQGGSEDETGPVY